ncbi:MAG: hypothetical protein Q8R07_03130 [Candidatus Uhrbacteria bacterium]|nr:hypothetical protein [Candidatus Uhrbacteria bacterium]
MEKADPLRDRMLSALMQIVGHEALEGHIGSWKEEVIDALPTLIPAALPLDDVKRHALEGGLRGLLERAKRMGAGANEGWFNKELNKVLGGSGKDGGKPTGLVDGLTAIGGMSKEARTAFGAVMALPGADALNDRLMAVQTTPQTFEPAFLMPTPDLQKRTLERIIAKIEADAVNVKAKAVADKAADDPLTRVLKRVTGLVGADKVTRAGVDALKASRLAQEEKDLRRRHPEAAVVLDDAGWRAVLFTYAADHRLILTYAYRKMNGL